MELIKNILLRLEFRNISPHLNKKKSLGYI